MPGAGTADESQTRKSLLKIKVPRLASDAAAQALVKRLAKQGNQRCLKALALHGQSWSPPKAAFEGQVNPATQAAGDALGRIKLGKGHAASIQTYRAINVTDLFQGLKVLLEEFSNSDPDFSWGDNDHTLVDPEAILDHLDGTGTAVNTRQLEALRRRICKLPPNTYVDLEK